MGSILAKAPSISKTCVFSAGNRQTEAKAWTWESHGFTVAFKEDLTLIASHHPGVHGNLWSMKSMVDEK